MAAADELANALAKIERFVDAARLVCDEALMLEIRQCVVFLHAASGPPVLAIDNVSDGLTDELRLLNVGRNGTWISNPVFVRLRERVEFLGADSIDHDAMMALSVALGYTGPKLHIFAAPAVGPTGWFATIVFGSLLLPPHARELQMAMLTNRFATWCLARGIERIPELPANCWLSRRQFRIAQLAIDGRTNSEIASELGISINTVKVRLKQAFARLGVTSRDELALSMRRFAPLDGVPIGVSKHGRVTVTRSADLVSWV